MAMVDALELPTVSPKADCEEARLKSGTSTLKSAVRENDPSEAVTETS